MIAAVRELAALLAADDITTDEILTWLGGATEDLDSNVLVDGPGVDGVTSANVVRDGAAPAHVTLELAEPLAPSELDAAFGESRRAYPDHAGLPVDLLYDLGRVTLIAAEDAGEVRRLTLRRDVSAG